MNQVSDLHIFLSVKQRNHYYKEKQKMLKRRISCYCLQLPCLPDPEIYSIYYISQNIKSSINQNITTDRKFIDVNMKMLI